MVAKYRIMRINKYITCIQVYILTKIHIYTISQSILQVILLHAVFVWEYVAFAVVGEAFGN